MRQTTGTRRSASEKIVKDIKRASRKQYSSQENLNFLKIDVNNVSSWPEHSVAG